MARTATITGVELVSVGTWAASTGVTKVTRADLEAMLAAHADGLVDHAPVKLGHVSPLNDTLGDGAPAYGWVVPTGIRKNAAGNDTLVGDLVGMPAALAEVAPTAYRRRSVEIAWGIKTPGGKTYAAALVGIALLGATPPAVKGLADVLALYTGNPEVERTEELEVVEGLEGNPVAVAMLTAARTAGAPVGQLDAMAAAAGARDTADVPPPVVVDDNDDPISTGTTAPTPTPEEGPRMFTDEQLRQMLSLEADADVNAELSRILAERNTDPATEPTEPVAPAEPQEPATPAEPAQPQEPAQEPELVQLSAGTYAELTALAEESRANRRNKALDDAIRTGRISPAERAAFAAQMETNEAGTITLLGALSPRFAVAELGNDGAPVDATALAAADEAYDAFEASTFPDLARVRQTPQA